MFPRACQMDSSCLIQFRRNLKNFANLCQMKWGPGLISLQASAKETGHSMNGTMLSKFKLLWLSIPPETAKILLRDIFWLFLKDEEFVSKTISDSNIDLDKFPASEVRQLAKKMESSKVTARHIKQVASDPQVAQINLMWHQNTDILASKHKERKSFVKPRPPSHKNGASYRPPVPSYYNNTNKKSFDAKHV